ncbi:hypothetical protein BKA65DRAFT_540736 [Rhexocercosporidium sp. MPI-PUGE-AT-0058]|nr:hypothetical protein BKA65DRAFT_540736 [Rhexocercosporidium sp. MPI-PUGE-AT-0058]
MENPFAPPPPPISPATQKRKDEAVRIGSILHDATGQRLRKRDRDRIFANYSALAKKYSHPRGMFGAGNKQLLDHTMLKYTGKSGLSPIFSLGTAQLTQAEWNRIAKAQRLKVRQRQRLRGFTTEELFRLGNVAPLNTSTIRHDLNVPLCTMFARDRWLDETTLPKHTGGIPVLGDVPGLWLPSNPRIWGILEPCLQIATLMLFSTQSKIWYDTLLNGEYAEVPHSVPGEKPVQRVRSRTPAKVAADWKKTYDRLEHLCTYIKFGFGTAYLDSIDGVLAGSDFPGVNGWTTDKDWFNPVNVWLSIELLVLSKVEVAMTIVHEFAHAVFKAMRWDAEPGKYYDTEPFVNDDPLSELGFSYEQQVFGGRVIPMVSPHYARGGPGLPLFGLTWDNWFNKSNAAYNAGNGKRAAFPMKVKLGDFDPWDHIDNLVVPTSWAAQMSSQDSWQVKHQAGSQDLVCRPLKYGIRYKISTSTLSNIIMAADRSVSTLLYLQSRIHDDAIAIDQGLPSAEQKAAEKENRRRDRERDILDEVHESWVDPPLSALADKDNMFDYPWDPAYDSEPESRPRTVPAMPPIFTDDCPRYVEIRNYVVANRAPLKLALDTMGLLPMPTLYRYFRELGGIDVTAREFVAFLTQSTIQKDLFLYEALPAPGVVIRIDGILSQPPPQISQSVPPAIQPTEEAIDALQRAVAHPVVQTAIYEYRGQTRDLCLKDFRNYCATQLEPAGCARLNLPLQRFEDLVAECHFRGNPNFVLGPAGIIRFTYSIARFRQNDSTPYMKAFIARLGKTVQEVEAEVRARRQTS